MRKGKSDKFESDVFVVLCSG